MKPTDEKIARDYKLWVKLVHDEIPDGEFYKMTVKEKLEIIAEIRHKKKGVGWSGHHFLGKGARKSTLVGLQSLLRSNHCSCSIGLKILRWIALI